MLRVAGGSIRDHLLTSYQKAMVSVVQAQFSAKSFQDGKDGIMSLAAEQGARTWVGPGGHRLGSNSRRDGGWT